MKNTLIKVDGTEQNLPDGELTLAQMYAAIGCDMVELVTLDDDRRLWCDEEGLLKNDFVMNRKATILFQEAIQSLEVGIVGNAILQVGKQDEQ